MRCDFAACYQPIDLYGMSDISGAHLSARVPGAEQFLINPYGLLFDQITASSLVEVDQKGQMIGESDDPFNPAVFLIHSCIRRAQLDVHCVLHTHTRAGNAVAMQKDGVLPLYQKVLIILGWTACLDFEGVVLDSSEQERMVNSLGDKMILTLGNHSLLTCGDTVGALFVWMHRIEKACRFHVDGLEGGVPLNHFSDEVQQKTIEQGAQDLCNQRPYPFRYGMAQPHHSARTRATGVRQTMPKFLTQEQVDSYWRDGFLSPVDIMSKDEALEIRSELERVEAAYGSVHFMAKPYLVTEVGDRLLHDSRILDVVEDIIGPDIMAWDGAFIIKEPDRKTHISWHQDLTYWGLDTVNDLVSIWFALSPATPESGTMRMVPASHRTGQLSHHATDDDTNILSRGQTLDVEIDEARAVDNTLWPGQMSLHHGLTFHASMPNVSADRRIGFNANMIRPSVRQLRVENDTAMLLRGTDEHGHYRLEDRARGDFVPEDVQRQGEISLVRGKEVNYDPTGRLVNTVFKGEVAE
ncbi:MAG: class II aldolase/adducin family protein [Rhodospirillales bacterium]|nr:class II aldolase/adducin family protein [Rhodospirillales bacterium]